MFKNLIVPIDGSDLSQKSLEKVKELAKADGAKVTLVYVSDPLPPIAYADSTMGCHSRMRHIKKYANLLQRKFLLSHTRKLAQSC